MRLGGAAASTAWSCARSRGQATGRALHGPLRTWRRGWRCSRTAVAELLRIAWRSVGAICARVAGEAGRDVDLLAGLRWIGIDELSHRKGQRYLTVVVDHHTGRLVWAAGGRDRRSVEAFLDALGPERCAQLELVSADMASSISGSSAERCPHAVRCVDPFHVLQLATDALDEIRREV